MVHSRFTPSPFNRMRRGIALAGALILGGCAALDPDVMGPLLVHPPAQTYAFDLKRMTLSAAELEDREFPQRLKSNIFLNEIAGSEAFSRLPRVNLKSSDINTVQGAVRQSLRAGGLLNEDRESARYQLTVSVTGNRLTGAIDLTVTTHMEFNLIDANTGETLMQESVASPGSTSFAEHSKLAVRVGRSMEKSVKGNIDALLLRLAKLRE